MADYISDVPVSRPATGPFTRHVDMNGFGWDADHGIFIPTDDSTAELYELPPGVDPGLGG